MPKKNNPMKKAFEGTLEEPEKYQPKGSYCVRCVHMLSNCQKLDFTDMPVLLTKDNVHLVACTAFEPEE